MKRTYVMGVLLAAANLLACGSSDGGNGTMTGSNGGATPGAGATQATAGELSTAEIDSLLFTREEEKLARDVYQALQGNDPAFTNIARSEQMHMDAVLTLLERYALVDPVGTNGVGVFTNTTLQTLHDQLVASGKVSVLEALKVGVTIEELDIRDIDEAKKGVTHPDILTTYDNLTRGSRNHLRTYYGRLTAAGGTYTPQYLDPATFQAIVTSPMETGGPAR